MNVVTASIVGGTGVITVFPEPDPANGSRYTVGQQVDVSVVPDAGFTFVNWVDGINGNQISTSASFVLTIGRSDIRLIANLAGEAVKDFDYGLKYYAEYYTKRSGTTRLEIEEKDYEGESSKITISNLTYKFGDSGADIFRQVLGTSLNFDILVTDSNKFQEFLSLDNRKFRVKYYRNYPTNSFQWTGYLVTDFIEYPEYQVDNYPLNLTATDGLKALDKTKLLIGQSSLSSAIVLISSILKQTWKDPLPINESIKLYETRMDVAEPQLEQWTVNQDFLYSDDDLYKEDGGVITYNPAKELLDVLTGVLSPFVVRIFQWNNEWYIIRINEYLKEGVKVTKYDPDGVYVDDSTYTNNQVLECLNEGIRRGENAYTVFRNVLKLGSINRPEESQILVEDFEARSWGTATDGRGRPSTNLQLNGTVLRNWDYINCQVFDGVRNSDYARVQRVTIPHGTASTVAQIWGTANGVSDPLMSYIQFWDERNTTFNNADVISVGAIFVIMRRGTDDANIPAPNSHVVGVTLKIGSSYLERVTDTTFGWTTTPTIMIFPVNNTNVQNTIDIKEIVVPETGQVEFRLHQLITVSGTRHRYVVNWDSCYVTLATNEALTYSEIEGLSVTDKDFANENNVYQTFVGDALTPLSSSAIKLLIEDEPVSENWTRNSNDSFESLLWHNLEDQVTLAGKNNFGITGKLNLLDPNVIDPDLSKPVIYKDRKCAFTSAKLYDAEEVWDIELYELEQEETVPTLNVPIDYELIEITGGEFVDANFRLYLNEVQVAAVFGSQTGNILGQVGDSLRIQYFYLANQIDPGVTDPTITLTISKDLVDIYTNTESIVDPSQGYTFNHTIVLESGDYEIIVTSGHS